MASAKPGPWKWKGTPDPGPATPKDNAGLCLENIGFETKISDVA